MNIVKRTLLSLAVAAALAHLGVTVGDRVALCSANNPDWIVAFWACAALGAVVVPLNAWWKGEELEFGLNDSAAKVLVCDARRLAIIADRLRSFQAGPYACFENAEALNSVESALRAL